jgi:hypothetical protein
MDGLIRLQQCMQANSGGSLFEGNEPDIHRALSDAPFF